MGGTDDKGGSTKAPHSRYHTKVYIVVAPNKDIIDAKLSGKAARTLQDEHPGSRIVLKTATK